MKRLTKYKFKFDYIRCICKHCFVIQFIWRIGSSIIRIENWTFYMNELLSCMKIQIDRWVFPSFLDPKNSYPNDSFFWYAFLYWDFANNYQPKSISNNFQYFYLSNVLKNLEEKPINEFSCQANKAEHLRMNTRNRNNSSALMLLWELVFCGDD